jgi:hypothetical protein
MVPALSLWLPILLSAVYVFIASSLVHMVLKYHNSDFKPVPSEDDVMDGLSTFDIPPGEYYMPYCTDMKDREKPEIKAKLEKGPIAFMTVLPNVDYMGKALGQWLVYCLLVGLFAAYLTGRALGPGAGFMEVFRFAGATAFGGYFLALIQNSIWYRRSWTTTLKYLADGFIYALGTAAIFAWLWP